MYGCHKTHTIPYHSQGSGECKQFNQTLLNLLVTLELEQQNRWVDYLPSLVPAYKNIYSVTHYVPTYLMFGRHIHLPIICSWGLHGLVG